MNAPYSFITTHQLFNPPPPPPPPPASPHLCQVVLLRFGGAGQGLWATLLAEPVRLLLLWVLHLGVLDQVAARRGRMQH